MPNIPFLRITAAAFGLMLLVGCTSTERGAVVGGVAGGAIAGALIGRVAGNRCRYSNGRGGSYIGRC